MDILLLDVSRFVSLGSTRLTLTTMSSIYVIRAQQARLEQNSRVWRRIEGRARRVVTAAASLTARVVEEKGDMYHADWRRNEGGALSELFTSESESFKSLFLGL